MASGWIGRSLRRAVLAGGLTALSAAAQAEVLVDFGDAVASDTICLPETSYHANLGRRPRVGLVGYSIEGAQPLAREEWPDSAMFYTSWIDDVYEVVPGDPVSLRIEVSKGTNASVVLAHFSDATGDTCEDYPENGFTTAEMPCAIRIDGGEDGLREGIVRFSPDFQGFMSYGLNSCGDTRFGSGRLDPVQREIGFVIVPLLEIEGHVRSGKQFSVMQGSGLSFSVTGPRVLAGFETGQNVRATIRNPAGNVIRTVEGHGRFTFDVAGLDAGRHTVELATEMYNGGNWNPDWGGFTVRTQYAVDVATDTLQVSATDDDFTADPVEGVPGGQTASVLGNDLVAGAIATSATAKLTIRSDGGIAGLALADSGNLIVPAGTDAGSYSIVYQLCNAGHPDRCAEASALIRVVAEPQVGVRSCTGVDLLANGSFEIPSHAGAAGLYPVDDLPGWNSTEMPVELRGSGTDGVVAHSGYQYARILPGHALSVGPLTVERGAQYEIFWVQRGVADGAALTFAAHIGEVAGVTRSAVSDALQWQTGAVVLRTDASADDDRRVPLNLRFEAVDDASVNGVLLDTVEICQTALDLSVAVAQRTYLDPSRIDRAGDAISLRLTVSAGSGNARPISDIAFTVASGVPVSPTLDGGDGNGNGWLDPGETWSYRAQIIVTQAMIDAGDLELRFSAAGSTVNGAIESGVRLLTVALSAAPSVSLMKWGSIVRTGDHKAAPGDAITYDYRVQNTGNITLRQVRVLDVHDGTGELPAPEHVALTDRGELGDSHDDDPDPAVWGVLAPGDIISFRTVYKVAAEDFNREP